MSRVFVGNIPFSCTENDLQHWFEVHGYEVSHIEIIRDTVTGESRGFGFIQLRQCDTEGGAEPRAKKRARWQQVEGGHGLDSQRA